MASLEIEAQECVCCSSVCLVRELVSLAAFLCALRAAAWAARLAACGHEMCPRVRVRTHAADAATCASRRSVIKVILQFCRENNLTQSFQAMSAECQARSHVFCRVAVLLTPAARQGVAEHCRQPGDVHGRHHRGPLGCRASAGACFHNSEPHSSSAHAHAQHRWRSCSCRAARWRTCTNKSSWCVCGAKWPHHRAAHVLAIRRRWSSCTSWTPRARCCVRARCSARSRWTTRSAI